VRVFHWSLAFFFFLAYFLEGAWRSMHSHAGYTVALLILFRLLWGVIGSRHARFSDFVTASGSAFTYLKQLLHRKAERHIGHDPAGAAMILTLLISVSVTTFSGMSLFAMEGSGPLAETFVSSWPEGVLQEIHEFFANFTLTMVVIHVLGVLLASFSNGENLIRAMLTGKKPTYPGLTARGETPHPGKEG